MCLQGSWIGAARGGDDVNWQDKAVDADRGARVGRVAVLEPCGWSLGTTDGGVVYNAYMRSSMG
jgi:hypothetical protein